MIECTKCGATNTDDRETCFKCTAVLDKPISRSPARKKNPSVGFIIALIIVFGIAYQVMKPYRGRGRGRSGHTPVRGCMANMKMLENALEMYDMDTPPEAGQTTVVCKNLEPVSVKNFPLVEGGYLQRWSKCPLTYREKPMDAEYFVTREGIDVGYALYVYCTIHGTISNPITKFDKKPFSIW